MDEEKLNTINEEAQSAKLQPDWSNAPTISDLKADLNNAKSDYDLQVAKIQDWLVQLNKSNYDNPANKKKEKKTRSEYESRLVRKQAEWRYPALTEPLLNTPELFQVKPRTAFDKERAEQNAKLLNYQFDCLIDKVNFIDEFVRALVNEGTAIVRTSWRYETREEKTDEPVIEFVDASEDLEYVATLEELANSVQLDPSIANTMTKQDLVALNAYMTSGQIIRPEESFVKTVVIADQPDLEVCDFRSVLPDPTCDGRIDKAKFVIYKFTTSLSDLRSAGIYDNLDIINPESSDIRNDTEYLSEQTETTVFNFQDKARKKFVAYEYWGYWDYDDSGIAKPIVATFVGDVLIRLDEAPFNHGKLPFDFCSLMPVPKSLYGEPDAELISDNQAITSAINRGLIDLFARSANGQRGYAKGTLDFLNKKRFVSGKDFEFNPGSHPEHAIWQGKFPELPTSALNMLALHNNDAEAFTGVKAFSDGLSGDSLGSSVGGIKSALDAASKRELSILRRMVSCLVSVAKKMISLNAQFLDGEQVVRITDEEFIEVNPEDLSGNFDLILDVSTAESDAERASDLSFMLQTLGNNAPFEFTKMILIEIAKLRRMPYFAKMLEDYQPQPDPFEEQMKQLELQMKEVEIMKASAQAKEELAKAELNLANARKSASEASMNDLNFIEQESGVTQERDLQKQTAQAAGNIELELAKSKLNNNNNNNS